MLTTNISKCLGTNQTKALGKEMISLTFDPEVLEFVKKRVATDSLELFRSHRAQERRYKVFRWRYALEKWNTKDALSGLEPSVTLRSESRKSSTEKRTEIP